MKKIFIVLGLVLASGANIAFFTYDQLSDLDVSNSDIWRTLMKITWVKKYNPQYNDQILYPKFNKTTLSLDKKMITVSGYLIPTEMYDGGGKFWVLSALPFKSCYFCGGAGPESVMEVYTQRKRTTFDSGKVTFRGRLQLNPDNPDHLIYILKEAKQVFKK
ncbi:hypothetical protein [uncultured Microscilla sp.]|uniref:hypothetical protein n=1 Tax=uncultured Microscilla sp. TaxID=432653 RepID=UPI002636060A|nr:hypothetical protein [uncultured Microscilla sp.]